MFNDYTPRHPSIEWLAVLLVFAGMPVKAVPFALAQVMHESGNFQNLGSLNYNNYSGIKYTNSGAQKNAKPVQSLSPEGGHYAHFASPYDWAVDFIRILNRGAAPPLYANDLSDYVNRLSANGYFTDSISNYKNGLQYHYDHKIKPLTPAIYAILGGIILLGVSVLSYAGWSLYKALDK